jgi:pimeloyl-ACP methyl ester carboxylesterase
MTTSSTSTARSLDWPAGATSHTTDLGGPVHHLDFGGPPGAPVVLAVHGLGGSALNWGLLAPLLTATCRVHAVDLFGHGRSGVPTGRGGLAADLAMLRRFVDEVVGGPAVLLGHSMGGVLALRYAAEHADTVTRLALLSPPVPGTTGRTDRALQARRALLRLPGVAAVVRRQIARLSAEQLVDRQLHRATPHAAQLPVAAVSASVAETRLRQGRPDAARAQAVQWAGIVDTMALLSRADAWRATLAGIGVPTLWLQGADDPMVAPAHAAVLAATRPDWPFRLREGTGHLLALEDPEWTAAQLRGWLG